MAVTDDGDENHVTGPVEIADPRTHAGAVSWQGHLDETALALVEGQKTDQVADGDCLLDEGAHQPGR